jgi:hypothetical protein
MDAIQIPKEIKERGSWNVWQCLGENMRGNDEAKLGKLHSEEDDVCLGPLGKEGQKGHTSEQLGVLCECVTLCLFFSMCTVVCSIG